MNRWCIPRLYVLLTNHHSLMERFEYALRALEAMAAGTPVVAWNNGGPTVTVRDGETGFLVQPYDTLAFAQCLLRLAMDPGLAERMGRAGHRQARQVFSYDLHNELLEGALVEAIRGHREAERAGENALLEPSYLRE